MVASIFDTSTFERFSGTLGSIIFVLCINDLPEAVKSYVLILADDTILFMQIASEEDSVMLQHDNEALDDWTKNWLLNFNADKCHVLTMRKIEEIKYMPRYLPKISTTCSMEKTWADTISHSRSAYCQK